MGVTQLWENPAWAKQPLQRSQRSVTEGDMIWAGQPQLPPASQDEHVAVLTPFRLNLTALVACDFPYDLPCSCYQSKEFIFTLWSVHIFKLAQVCSFVKN